jgi:RimJ/RimL family protein N-acetyltransferase
MIDKIIDPKMIVQKKINEETIDALSRNFFKEAEEYGFDYKHYIKFVNTLLEYAIVGKVNGKNRTKESAAFRYDKKINSLPVKSEHISIREVNPSKDMDTIHKWLKDDYGKYFMLSFSSNDRMDIEQLLNNQNNYFGLITLKDSSPAGLMAFLHADHESHKAELRKLIGDPDFRGKGYGKEATLNWIAYGRDTLGLKKIYLRTVETNIRNIKLNEDLGFKVEGILRNEVKLNNTYHDVLRMGLVFE